MKNYIHFVFLICSFFTLNAQINFEDQATLLGLGETCGITYLGNGISFYDYNQDGWDDITLTTELGQPVRFFKNINGLFTEEFLGVPNLTYQTKQVNWVDFDNDGDKDLFVTSDTNGVKLLENIGGLNFQDITSSAGFPDANMFTYGASWGDIDNDGWLDVFLSNRDETYSVPNYLYKNNGDDTFTNVSQSAGILPLSEFSFCSAFFDYNNDGFQDIYVSNDKIFNQNRLYKNNGDGTFNEVSALTNTDVSIDAMTVTIGDYNNDGWQDIYLTNTPSGNVLFNNNGDETFTDVTISSGTEFNSVGWGAVFLDAENDMDLDLYVSGMFTGIDPNFLSAAFYENDGSGVFSIPNSGFVNDSSESYSNAIGDVDNDGLPEIIVSNANNEDIFIWKNESVTSNNWLKVNLEGVQSNRDAIGSQIEISINGNKQYRYTHCGEGYLSQNSTTEFFGLGDNLSVDNVKVKWLSGVEDVYYNVSANQVLNLVEGGGELSVTSFENPSKVSVYPNPVSNDMFIKSNEPVYYYEIYSILGVKIISNKLSGPSIKIDVSQLQSGSYFLKIVSNGIEKVHRFIKD